MKYLLLLMFIPLSSNAQDIHYAPHSISINFLSLLSPYHSNLNLSYEYRFSERFAVEVGVAPIFPFSFNATETGRKRDKGFILRVEPKLFISNSQVVDTLKSTMVSCQFFTTYHSYVDLRKESWDADYIHRSSITNFSLGLIPHLGYHESGGGTTSELSAGFGSKWIYITNDNVSTHPNLAPNEDHQFFYHTIPGWMRQNILNFGAKIGSNFSSK